MKVLAPIYNNLDEVPIPKIYCDSSYLYKHGSTITIAKKSWNVLPGAIERLYLQLGHSYKIYTDINLLPGLPPEVLSEYIALMYYKEHIIIVQVKHDCQYPANEILHILDNLPEYDKSLPSVHERPNYDWITRPNSNFTWSGHKSNYKY